MIGRVLMIKEELNILPEFKSIEIQLEILFFR